MCTDKLPWWFPHQEDNSARAPSDAEQQWDNRPVRLMLLLRSDVTRCTNTTDTPR